MSERFGSRLAKGGHSMDSDQPITTANLTGYFGQTVFRFSNYDSPFWARNNRISGRWHEASERVAVQYLSVDPETAWAELVRHEDLRTEAEIELIRTKMWAAEITQSNLVDYSTFEKA